MSIREVIIVAIPLLALLMVFATPIRSAAASLVDAGRRARRAGPVRSAFLQAALEDARFDLDSIVTGVRTQLEGVDGALARGSTDELEQLFGEPAVSLERIWRRRAVGGHITVKRARPWSIEPAAIRNDGDGGAQVVIRVATTVRVWRGRLGFCCAWLWYAPWSIFTDQLGAARRRCCAWIVLRFGASGWELDHIEQGGDGMHFEAAPLITGPDDEERLHALAIRELADDELAGATPLPIAASAYADAHEALLDLALVDARYEPELVTELLREIVSLIPFAGTDGDPRLARLCDGRAAEQLAALSGLGSPKLTGWRALRLVEDRDSPQLYVDVKIRAGTRHATPRAAQRDEFKPLTHDHHGCWRLRCDADSPGHWRLANAFAHSELRPHA